MRKLSVVVAAMLVLALAGCVPTAIYEGGVDSALRDVPAVEDVYITSKNNEINSPAYLRVEVTLRTGSTPTEASDAVKAWLDSSPTGVSSSITLHYADRRYGATLQRNDGGSNQLIASAVEWSTLAQIYPSVSVGFSSPTDSSVAIVLPQITTPSDVRAAVDEVRAQIADVETPASWWIRSTGENGAVQGVEVITESGLPDTTNLDQLDLFDAPFASALTIGDAYLSATLTPGGTSVDIELTPEEFINVPVTQIPDAVVATSTWPVMQLFIDQASEGGVNGLSLRINGTVMASLTTDSCERPETERFPLDFEVWDYWASTAGACTP